MCEGVGVGDGWAVMFSNTHDLYFCLSDQVVKKKRRDLPKVSNEEPTGHYELHAPMATLSLLDGIPFSSLRSRDHVLRVDFIYRQRPTQ